MKKTPSCLGCLLLVWLVTIVVWGMYRYFFRFGELTDELIFKPLIFILPVLIYLLLKERVSLNNLSLSRKNLSQTVKYGLAAGFGLVAELYLLSYFKGKIINIAFLIPHNLLLNLLISTLTATWEEILYRGFLMPRFWKILKSGYAANFLTAGLFCLTHLWMAVLVLNYSGGQLMVYLWLMFVLGLANGLVFQKTRSTYGPIITHTLWNFGNTLFI